MPDFSENRGTPTVCCIALIVLVSALTRHAEARTDKYKTRNKSKTENMIGFSTTYSIENNTSMADTTRVYRKVNNKWEEETDGWSYKVVRQPGAIYTLQVDIDGAAPVTPGTVIGWTVTTSSPAPGVKGHDYKYPSDNENAENGLKNKGLAGYNDFPTVQYDVPGGGSIHQAVFDSIAIYATGESFTYLGVDIPVGHYGYFYQLNSKLGLPLSELQISYTGSIIDSGVLGFPHDGEASEVYRTDDETIFDPARDEDDPAWNIHPVRAMATMEALSVTPGVDVTLTLLPGLAKSEISLSPGQSTNVMYLISPDPPVRNGLQGFVKDADGNVSGSRVWAPFLRGDYSGNGVFDAADYTVWRDMFGETGEGLAADGTGPEGIPDHVVDNLDFDYWRTHFGESIFDEGHGAASDLPLPSRAPEPDSFGLASLAGAMLMALGCRVSNRSDNWRRLCVVRFAGFSGLD